MTKNQISKLRPEFLFGYMSMVEWYEVSYSLNYNYCTIRSGLKNADGETLSPYHYEHTEIGKDSLKKATKHFTDWWNSLDHKKLYIQYSDDIKHIRINKLNKINDFK